MPLAHTHT